MKQIEFSVSEIVYLLYFLVLFGSRSVGIFEGGTLYKAVLAIGLLLYAFKELLTVKTAAEHAVSILLLLMALVVYVKTGEKGLLLYTTMMLGMKGVLTDRVLGLSCLILCIAMPVMEVAAMFGLQEQHDFVFERAFVGSVRRYSWGYPGPNVAHTTFIILLVCIVCLMNASAVKQQVCLAALMAAASLYVYSYTFSNTGLIGCTVLICGYIYLNARGRLGIAEKGAVLLAYPVIGAVSVGVPLLTSEDLFWRLDSFFHNRMNYSRYYLTTEPITLFGTRFAEAPHTDYYVDSAYIYSFLQLGVIPFLILTGLFIWLAADCLKHDRRNELAVILAFCVIGLSDPFLYNLAYKNVMFIWYGELMYRTLHDAPWASKGVLGREIRLPLNRLGERNIVMTWGWVDRIYNWEVGLHNYWNEKCTAITVRFFICFFVVLAGTMSLIGMKFVEGRIDVPEEWTVLHHCMNAAIAAGVVLILISIVLDNFVNIHKNTDKDTGGKGKK